MCSCLAPEPIPDWLFRTELPEEDHASLPMDLQTVLSDRLAYQEARAALLRYSLLEISAERLQVHRLVQTVVRDSDPGDESWPKAALRLVRHSLQIDFDDPRTADTAVPLTAHALTVVGYAERNETELEAASWLLDRLATGAQCRGALASARDLMQRAIALAEKAYEPDHPNLAIRYSNLATIELALGDLPAARDLMQRAIDIEGKAYEPDHPNLAIRYWNLGRIEEADGNIEPARELIERAHAIRLHRLGPEHPKTQDCAAWLAKHGRPS